MELDISEDDEEVGEADPSPDASAAPTRSKAAAAAAVAPLVDPEVMAAMDRNAKLWYPYIY